MFKFFFRNKRFVILLLLIVAILFLSFFPLPNVLFLKITFFGWRLTLLVNMVLVTLLVIVLVQNLKIAHRQNLRKISEENWKRESEKRHQEWLIEKARLDKVQEERNAELLTLIDPFIQEIEANKPKAWDQILRITGEWWNREKTVYQEHLNNPLCKSNPEYNEKVERLENLILDCKRQAVWADIITVSDLKKQIVFNGWMVLAVLKNLNILISTCHNDSVLKSYLDQYRELMTKVKGKADYSGYQPLYVQIHKGWASNLNVINTLSLNGIVFEQK